MRKLLTATILVWASQAAFGSAWAAETELDRYIAKPDANYSYQHYHTDNALGYRTYFIDMVSQQWRSADEVDRTLWEHDLMITVPTVLDSASEGTAFLLIDGGANGKAPPTDTDQYMATLALLTGNVVAVVRQIPNQPLFFADEVNNARTEDEILAYSMDKYLVTADPEWPVHLAMTKAAVRAMDTIQDFLATQSLSIDDFMVLGGSKRGWTTWLAAAVDPRIRGIAPVSIDLLDLGSQFVHHWEAYGFYTPAIDDYVEFDLPCRMRSRRGQELLQIIDPYFYRERYTMPKLIINSTGDQFFVPDSSRFYYDDLPGPKKLRYTLNTDHKQGDNPVDLIATALFWAQDVKNGDPGPQFDWSFEADGSIRVQTIEPEPLHVYLWQATNPDARDFRLETLGPAWTKTELSDLGGGLFIGSVPEPAEGFTAYTVEVVYEEDPILALFQANQIYTTGVRVTPDAMPFAGTSCPPLSAGVLENPQPASYQSGITVLSGWICDAGQVEIEIDGERFEPAGYGTVRNDTGTICGDTDNGFGLLFNMNLLGDGAHSLRALADGREIGKADVTVTTLGADFLRGASGTYELPDFPMLGQNVTVQWQEGLQNFALTAADLAGGATESPAMTLSAVSDASQGFLGNPRPDSNQSGIGVISGWVCDAGRVDIEIDGAMTVQAAYGTPRRDTESICGDTDNGFGLLYNMNLLGDGVHRVRALADGQEIGSASFTVTTLGSRFLRGASGSYQIDDFPTPGESRILQWQQSLQNFVIRE